LIICLTLLFAGIVQGSMVSPLARAAVNKRSLACGAAGTPGRVLTRYTPGQHINVEWDIVNADEGTCYLDLSTTGKDTDFQQLGSIPNCADLGNASFQSTLQLPSHITCEQCTLRFRWVPKFSGDTYIDCADVSITFSDSPTTQQSHPVQTTFWKRDFIKRDPQQGCNIICQ